MKIEWQLWSWKNLNDISYAATEPILMKFSI